MPTGLPALTMILVASLAFGSCQNIDMESPLSEALSQEDICGDLCKNHELETFAGEKLHIEVESQNFPSQIFYWTPPEALAKGLYLEDGVTINGIVGQAGPYYEQDLASLGKQSSFFSDLIAIPNLLNSELLNPPLASIKTKLMGDFSFRLKLLPKQNYTLILNPGGHYERAPILLNLDTSKDSSAYVNIAIPEDAKQVRGKVLTNVMSIFSSKKSSHNLKATVLQGGRPLSSVGLIKESGDFNLELAKLFMRPVDELPLYLVIEAQDPAEALPVIKYRIKNELLEKDEVNLGGIELGHLGKALKLKIKGIGADKEVLKDGIILMEAKVGNGLCFIKKEIDPSGETILPKVFESDYDIAIVPPSHSPYGLKILSGISIKADSNDGILNVELPFRQALLGTIYGPNNLPLAGAQVEFSRIGKVGNFASEDIFADQVFKVMGLTNQAGKICRTIANTEEGGSECSPVSLDEGRYLLFIKPPLGSKASYNWSTFDFPSKDLDLRLPEPKVVVGKILSPDNQNPVAHAFVTIYSTKPNPHLKAKVLANAITGENGVFRAFLNSN